MTSHEDCLSAQLAVELCELLEGEPVGSFLAVPPSADICYSLELFLPRALREQFPEWQKEGLDGIFVARATKTGPMTAALLGTCILLSDQAVTPFDLELGTAGPDGPAAITRLRLGEPGTGLLRISGPPSNSREAQRLLAALPGRKAEVAWSYVLDTGRGDPLPRGK